MGGADWPRFSWVILPAGGAGIILTLDIAQLVDKYASKLKRCFVYIGQHTMFILMESDLLFMRNFDSINNYKGKRRFDTAHENGEI